MDPVPRPVAEPAPVIPPPPKPVIPPPPPPVISMTPAMVDHRLQTWEKQCNAREAAWYFEREKNPKYARVMDYVTVEYHRRVTYNADLRAWYKRNYDPRHKNMPKLKALVDQRWNQHEKPRRITASQAIDEMVGIFSEPRL